MLELIGIFSFTIILLIVIGFIFFNVAGFIKPTTVQIQLFGIHLTIFGGFIINDMLVIGFLIMLLGLAIGLYGSFKDSDSFNQTEENKN
ncbi:hypothetical protein NC661_13615 [Aquibacillus koreensis]|uniref:Uncharacterized protein n=1 Tax=Aquibacillus koreensis TaxID=279446 RepID=A0A9X3WQ58_9BACI|nr:hypothetical protein [Aquibacillus koreensis]MCT2536238.1 hypothetical protein [Aquibacillus koreensis]MDC3421409.1 hypothetical protein [Aquibacillus koreensis]